MASSSVFLWRPPPGHRGWHAVIRSNGHCDYIYKVQGKNITS